MVFIVYVWVHSPVALWATIRSLHSMSIFADTGRNVVPVAYWRSMTLRILILCCIVLFVSAGLAFAQAQGEGGVITARVTMGTAGQTLPTNLNTELLFLPNGQGPPTITSAAIDADGVVRFDDLDTAPEHRYLVRVTFGGEEFYSALLQFGPDERQKTVDVTVYDTTNDLSALELRRTNVIVEARNDRWVIAALYVFQNGSDRVLVADEEHRLFLPLPPNATNVGFQEQALEEEADVTSDGVGLSAAFHPGQRRIVFSYALPYEAPAQTLELPLGMEAQQAVFLIVDLNQQVSVPTFREADPVQTDGGQMYLAFEGRDVPAGATVRIQMTDLPSETPQAATSQSRSSAVPVGLDEWLPAWTPFVLLGVAIGSIVLYLLYRPAPTQAEEQAARRRRRDDLLDAIATLDDRFEAGEIGEQTYRRQRETAHRELKQLLRREKKLPSIQQQNA